MTKVLDLVLATVLLAACGGSPVAQNGTATAPVTGSSGPRVILADGASIAVEVVADPESRARGLMYRPSLADNRGMLFLFPAPDVHSFWMKDTLIPLDMIWLDTERRVIAIEGEVPPCQADPCPSYGPSAKALYVLELAAGRAAAHGIEPGDVLEFRDIGQYKAR